MENLWCFLQTVTPFIDSNFVPGFMAESTWWASRFSLPPQIIQALSRLLTFNDHWPKALRRQYRLFSFSLALANLESFFFFISFSA